MSQQPKPKRRGIGKRIRFEVFARDGFKCRYCGISSANGVLVIDHVHPVSKGGTNESDNLITSCESCNQGKTNKLLEMCAPTEEDRLRMAQERNEIIKLAEKAKAANIARAELETAICNYWCSARGTAKMHRHSLHVLRSYADTYGIETLCSWIDIAVERLDPDIEDEKMARYVSGIKKKALEEMEASE